MENFNVNSNISRGMTILTMESLQIPPSVIYPAFFLGAITYCIILLSNTVLIFTIALHSTLHKPMHLLLFNLPINDIVGASAFFPQFIYSILAQKRSISYPACIVQATLIHMYGVGALAILSVMAYDRYIAICCPLRYNTVMNNTNLVKIITVMWLAVFAFISVIFALLSRFEICRTHIVDIYCNNPSLLKLSCDDIRVNNYYGLFTIALSQGGSLILVIYTYIQILHTCLINKKSGARKKAIQTCATHLMVFLFLEINALFTLLAHRLNRVSPYLRRSFGVSVLIFPPLLNPLIYGLKTKEIQEKMIFYKKCLIFGNYLE